MVSERTGIRALHETYGMNNRSKKKNLKAKIRLEILSYFTSKWNLVPNVKEVCIVAQASSLRVIWVASQTTCR